MDEDDGPAVVIKRRPKSRPSSTRTSAPLAAPQPDAAPDRLDVDEADEGNVAVVRKKKTAADKVKAMEGGKKAARLSFGGGEEGQNGNASNAATSRLLPRSGVPTAVPSTSASSAPAKPSSSSLYSADYLSQLRSQTLSAPKKRVEGIIEDDDDDAPSAEIPTANAIAAARLRRETMRKIGATDTNGQQPNGDGFISLDMVVAPFKSGESRLVREEDEVGEGDDEMAEYTGAQDTVPLGRNATQARKRQQRSDAQMLIDDAEAEAIDEEDEEAMEWEAAQVRRAGNPSRDRPQNGNKSVYRAAPIPQPLAVPGLDGIQSQLKSALHALEISHAADDEVLQSFDAEVAALDRQETEMRSEVERINAKHEWFRSFFEWLEDVAAFLDAKYPRLERIERDNVAHHRERLAMIQERRYADDSDDVALFTGAAVASRPPLPAPVDSDEGPPPQPTAQGSMSGERQMRREARVERAADVADEKLEDDAALDLVKAVATLSSMLAELFVDVESPEFRDPGVGIRPRFEDWRRRYPDEFGKAFGTLAMVGVWEFWARVELGIWNPFAIPQWESSPASLERYPWHGALAAFSHVDEPAVPGIAVDDTDAVSAVVESVIVPRLQALATEGYDPYSASATKAALDFVEEITFCIDRGGQKFEALVAAFLSQIYRATMLAQSLIVPHLAAVASPLHALDPSAFAARERFARRQLLLAAQAVRWKRHARGMLVRGWMCGLEEGLGRELVGKVVLPVLEAGWSTGGRELAQEFVQLFASSPLPADIRARLTAA